MTCVRLDKLLAMLKGSSAKYASSRTVLDYLFHGVKIDSRLVQDGDIFVALEGEKHNGENYIPAAIQAGAACIIARPSACAEFREMFQDACFLLVEDPKSVLPLVAKLFYPRMPAHVVAVTGTNGKTSVAEFTRQMWHHLGYKAASIGTLGVRGDGFQIEGSLTTPDALTLYKTLDELVEKGVTHVVFEASSHGLQQQRLQGVPLEAAGFTNLTRDHLDYHGSLAAYLNAKSLLFSNYLDPDGVAVLNADVPEFSFLKEKVGARNLITYGKSGHDLKVQYVESVVDGLKASLLINQKPYHAQLPLAGRFQLINVLCAIGLVWQGREGVLEALIPCLETLKPVPGRMDYVASYRGGRVYVDYAHTPDALETVLRALRPHTEGRLHVVFGCGGNRDKGKRLLMGEIAGNLADFVIVTDDNPRFEDPKQIRREILAGCPRAEEIEDRGVAIVHGLNTIEPGDVVVIAGKGHEQGQIVGDTIQPFHDADVVLKHVGRG